MKGTFLTKEEIAGLDNRGFSASQNLNAISARCHTSETPYDADINHLEIKVGMLQSYLDLHYAKRDMYETLRSMNVEDKKARFYVNRALESLPVTEEDED